MIHLKEVIFHCTIYLFIFLILMIICIIIYLLLDKLNCIISFVLEVPNGPSGGGNGSGGAGAGGGMPSGGMGGIFGAGGIPKLRPAGDRKPGGGGKSYLKL